MMENIQHSATVSNDIATGRGDPSQLVILMVLLGIFLFIMLIGKVYYPFIKRARYFKMEMKRSDGGEYLYWRSQLRKLYRKYIPFAALFIRKRR